MGADHRHKTHLITVALLAALQQSPVYVFGKDYPTPDGTCIRDYIHVEDLADSHVLAVDALVGGAATTAYNVGLGAGFSVLEVLDSVERVIGGPLDRRPHPPRPGDPAALVADPSRIRNALGWTPHYTDLDDIITTAWKWHSSHPQGYGD
jgi:UDP-glucose 4-epimerase